MINLLLIILLLSWVLGFGVFQVAGGMIHLLVVLAVIIFLARLIQGRRSVL